MPWGEVSRCSDEGSFLRRSCPRHEINYWSDRLFTKSFRRPTVVDRRVSFIKVQRKACRFRIMLANAARGSRARPFENFLNASKPPSKSRISPMPARVAVAVKTSMARSVISGTSNQYREKSCFRNLECFTMTCDFLGLSMVPPDLYRKRKKDCNKSEKPTYLTASHPT